VVALRGLTTSSILLCALPGCPGNVTTDARWPAAGAPLQVFAEGPCPELSIHAVGERRFVVYGETGYDLRGWLPGDAVAAAQSLVEVKDGCAYFNAAFLAGLPTDARGYVPGAIEIGGDFETGVWLLHTTTRYAAGGTGALFEREAEGFLFAGEGWRPSDEPVALPLGARQLPELPQDACAGDALTFVPLAWRATPAGGIVVAGRCDDDKPANPHDPVIVVLHGRPGASAWRVERLEETDPLDGIINLELAARGDDDVYLVAYEPFRPLEQRQSFVAHYDGSRWRALDWALEGGTMGIALDNDGGVYLAASRALLRRDRDGDIAPLPLPPLRFADVARDELHVHTVRAIGGELWVEAGYRVNVPAEGGRERTIWASALYASGTPAGHYYCDAREPAEEAFYEVSQ
jgi:hypothetical protein